MFSMVCVSSHRSRLRVSQRLPVELIVKDMHANEIVRQPRASGHTCQRDPYVNSDGQLILLVDNVAMFRRDAEDLLMGRTRIEEIVGRNRGKNLGWTYPTTAENKNT